MSKLEEIRKRISDKIEVTDTLHIQVEEQGILIIQPDNNPERKVFVLDIEIKPLIKKLQELIA